MKVAFDSSVLVAALVARHPDHERAAIWLEAAASGRLEGVASWHAAAEAHAVLTRLPLVPRLSTTQAQSIVLRLKDVLTLEAMTPAIYRAALRRVAEAGIRSGGILDALHLAAAERAGSDVFLTFNVEDFSRLARPDSPRVAEPPDPPSLKL